MQKLWYAVVRDCDEWVGADGYHRCCWLRYEHLKTLVDFLAVADFDDLSTGYTVLAIVRIASCRTAAISAFPCSEA